MKYGIVVPAPGTPQVPAKVPTAKTGPTAPKSKATKTPAAGSNLYIQPPFDTRIYALKKPLSSDTSDQSSGDNLTNMQRGFMTWDPNMLPSGYTKAAVLNFLFNPSDINASYGIGDSSIAASINFSNTTKNQSAALTVGLGQTVGWQLLYDRTYEVNWPMDGSNSLCTGLGCEADMIALKQFTGMYVDATNTGKNTGVVQGNGKDNPAQWNSPINQGIMQICPSYVYFAKVNDRSTGNAYGLKYYGYIDSWSVDYTHFSQYMIPMRCAVTISFTLIPPPQANTTGSGSATSTAINPGGPNQPASKLAKSPGGILPTPSGGGSTPITGGNPQPIIRTGGRLGR